jgi:hypothetical protein
VGHEDRHAQIGQYSCRGAAEHEVTHPTVPETAHDEEARTSGDSMKLKGFADWAIARSDLEERGGDVVLCQIIHEHLADIAIGKRLFV